MRGRDRDGGDQRVRQMRIDRDYYTPETFTRETRFSHP